MKFVTCLAAALACALSTAAGAVTYSFEIGPDTAPGPVFFDVIPTTATSISIRTDFEITGNGGVAPPAEGFDIGDTSTVTFTAELLTPFGTTTVTGMQTVPLSILFAPFEISASGFTETTVLPSDALFAALTSPGGFDFIHSVTASATATRGTAAVLGYQATGYYTVTYEVPDGAESPVPEPASWAMLIAGFGLTGAALRRRAAPAMKAA